MQIPTCRKPICPFVNIPMHDHHIRMYIYSENRFPYSLFRALQARTNALGNEKHSGDSESWGRTKHANGKCIRTHFQLRYPSKGCGSHHKSKSQTSCHGNLVNAHPGLQIQGSSAIAVGISEGERQRKGGGGGDPETTIN